MIKIYIKFPLLLIILLFVSSCKPKIDDVKKFHKQLLTIDTHVDIPIKLVEDSTYNPDKRHTIENSHARTDFPRMDEGGLDAIVFVVWTAQHECDNLHRAEVNKKAHEIIDRIYSVISASNKAEIAFTPNDILKINTEGKHPVLIGMENGYPIGTDIKNVEHFYNLGVRYITLCHVEDNDICDSSTDESEDEGLTDFGVKVIKEMNRLGIIIDVSHISDSSFYQVIRFSKAPVLASHSNARALCNHPRNLSDKMLKLLAQNGGVVDVNFYTGYLVKSDDDSTESSATIDDVLNHIDYIAKLIGTDHVGIGSDFDGGGHVKGLEDVSQMANITKGLLARGYSQEDIRKIWSGNFLRLFRSVEKVAKKMKNSKL